MRSGNVSVYSTPGKLFALCKLPRAGGSTFSNRWAAEGDRPRVILGLDDFRLALHGQEYAKEAEGIVASTIDIAAKALLSRGYDVLMDETCTSEHTFLRYMRLDPDFELIFIDTPLEICLQRACSSGKMFLIPVIERLHPQFLWMRDNHGLFRTKFRTYLLRNSPQQDS